MILDSFKHKGLRNNLVEILKSKGINDRNTLNAIGKIPRHIFFEDALLSHAYQDKAFPIGEGQTISQPYTVAFQTQCLAIQPGDKVLEIGTGSGYQTSVLCEIGAKVFTIERHNSLHNKAKQYLAEMGYTAFQFCGDGTKGLPTYAPFDKIIVTAGGPSIPSTYIEQLKVGGRLIIPVGNEEHQEMILIKKITESRLAQKKLGKFQFVPLIGKNGW